MLEIGVSDNERIMCCAKESVRNRHSSHTESHGNSWYLARLGVNYARHRRGVMRAAIMRTLITRTVSCSFRVVIVL
jgi:hypothetical protein